MTSKKLLKTMLLSAGLLTVGQRAIAQSGTQEPTPASTPANKAPAAGTVSAAGSLYNVNPYDGTASVTIPIYDYSIAGLNLGISLSYDTHGIKVDQTAGEVGLGWGMSTGGSISRQVNGLPDELIREQYNNETVRGKWTKTDVFPLKPEGEHDLLSASFGGRSLRFSIVHEGTLEAHFDPYTPGMSAELYTENFNTGEVKPYEWSDLQNDKSKTERQLMIVIKDEYHNTYYFRRGNLKKQVPDPDLNEDFSVKFQAPTEWIPETWDLIRVITKYQDTVKYTYGYYTDVSYPLYKNEELRINDVNYDFEAAGIKVIKNKEELWEGDVSYLTRIEYPNGTEVLFDRPDIQRYDMIGINPVSRITIRQRLDDNVVNSLTYKFNYSYYHTPNSSVPATDVAVVPSMFPVYMTQHGGVTSGIQNAFRLKLNSIERIGTDGSTTEPYYSFDYNTTALPARLSPSKDYYGYYNGQTPVFHAVNGPSYNYWPTRSDLSSLGINKRTFSDSRGTVTFGVDKTPSLDYCKAGILQKITNAGGGTIEIFYKDHTLVNPAKALNGFSYFSEPDIIPSPDLEGSNANDGLCIDKVVVKDGLNPDNTTSEEYEYEGGQRFYPGGHSWYVYHMTSLSNYQQILQGRECFNTYLTPMQLINGSNHGYSYVTIRKYGYNHYLLGSTKYHFTNLILEGTNPVRSNIEFFKNGNVAYHYPYVQNQNTYDFANPLYYQFGALHLCDYRMGKMLEEESYDQFGTLTGRTAYTYDDRTGAYGINLTEHSGGANNVTSSYGAASGGYYTFSWAPYLLGSKTSTVYTGTGNSSTTVNYTYNDRMLLNTEQTTDHLGRQTTQLYTYTSAYADYGGSRLPNPTGANAVYDNNFISEYNLPTGVKTFKTINGTEYCLGGTRNDYKEIAFFGYRMYGTNYYRPYKTYTLLNEQPFPLSAYPQGEQVVNEITKYDSHNNIIEVKYEDKDVYAASIWDTRIGKKIAAVRNAQYDQIAYTSFEGTNYGPAETDDENKGNWRFDPRGVTYDPDACMTGKYDFDLKQGNIWTVNPLTQGKQYILSFWASGGAPYIKDMAAGYVPVMQQKVGSWLLYTVTITGTGTPLTISQGIDGARLDELRLHPADATMTTTAYEPMFGPCSVSDARNNIIYTEYDAMGRATISRDINRKVLSVTKTVIGGTTND